MPQKTDKPKIGRPATGKTPIRNFRINDEDWQQIESAAKLLGETVSEYVRRVMLKDAGRTLKANQK